MRRGFLGKSGQSKFTTPTTPTLEHGKGRSDGMQHLELKDSGNFKLISSNDFFLISVIRHS